MPIFLSFAYPISYLLAFAGLVLVPASKSHNNRFISHIALSFFVLMSLDALFAGILTIAGIPTNLFSSSIFHILIASASVYLIFRKGEVQCFHFDVVDAGALVVLGAIALLCGRAEFGPDLTIHWLASDAAVHLDRIRTIVETDAVHGMYVAWNFMAPWVEIASMYLDSTEVYKALIIGDVLILYFGGLLFYSLTLAVIPHAGSKQRLIFAAASVLYLLGYPLNSMLYGFFYLNVGVFMAVCAVIFCTKLIRSSNAFNVAGVALSLFGLINSYALFAPSIYSALFIAIIWNQHRHNVLLCRKTVALLALVFVLTGVLGIYFTYYGTFPTTGTVTASSAISWNGGIYRNLYSNQILLVPLALVFLWSCRKRLLETPMALAFLATAATILGTFILTFSNTISTYYFFKLYFLFSPLMFACAVCGILYAMAKGARELLACSAVTIVAIGTISITGADHKLASYAPERDYGIISAYHPSIDIYSRNYSLLRTASEFDPQALELYEEANHLKNATDRPIGFLGSIEQYYWWVALVRQGDSRCNYPAEIRPWSTQTTQEACDNIIKTCDYVLVLTREPYESVGSIESREAAAILTSAEHEVVYSNDAGYIIHLL